jgi:hypothetical protein
VPAVALKVAASGRDESPCDLLLDGSAESGFTNSVPPEQRPRSAFDEKAALAELERLQRAIEESRRQRKDAVTRFDQFVASFERPAPLSDRVEVIPAPIAGQVQSTGAEQAPSASAPPASWTRTINREPAGLPPRDAPPQPPVAPAPASPAPPSAEIEAFPAEPAVDTLGAVPRVPEAFVVPDTPVSAGRHARRRRLRLVVLAAAVVVIVAAVLLMRSSRSGEEPVPAQTSADPAAASPAPPATVEPPSAPVTEAAPPAATPAAPGVHGELTTIRTAWVRVTIDGERAIERELPPDARIPLRAERSIVVRVGDAGAVRLTIDGRDLGALGAEGQVVTRTFTARPSAGSGQSPRQPR